MNLVIYGDFNCPFSALASARAERLERSGDVRVVWRAVEHDPDIPPAGEPVEDAVADEIDGEIEQVRGLLRPGEDLALRRPPVRSNTRAAVEMYAGVEPERRAAVRAELFDRYWTRGQNIGNEHVLDDVGVTRPAAETAAQWRDEWLEPGRPIVPMMRFPDGYVSRGLGALSRLADLLSVGRP